MVMSNQCLTRINTCMNNMAQKFDRLVFSLVLLLTFALGAKAQEAQECFTYADEGKTVIIGLTADGQAATELEIPAIVTSVKSNAFCKDLAPGKVETLTILGDPIFSSDALSYVKPTLTSIDAGSGMSSDNIKTMLTSLGSGNNLSTLEIGGYTDVNATINWTDMTEILPATVHVFLPAAKVGNQVFGAAAVYGSFTLTGELATFCGSVTFDDTDDGSNFLFYVAKEFRKETKEVYIARVRYVAANQGVLIHNVAGTSHTVRLKRVDTEELGDKEDGYNTEMDKYSGNMLVGVTGPTSISATIGDKTNMVLKQGAFYPTSGGELKANKAYLQVLTSDLNYVPQQQGEGTKLRLTFDNDETTGVEAVEGEVSKVNSDTNWYTLSGQRLSNRPSAKGLYIRDGRVFIVK